MCLVSFGLVSEDVDHGSLGSFDLARQNGLAPHVHGDEEVRVRKGHHSSVQSSQRPVRDGEPAEQSRRQVEILGRQIGRNEGPITGLLLGQDSGPAAFLALT